MKICTQKQMIDYMSGLKILPCENRKAKKLYVDCVCAFDIETYTLPEEINGKKQSVMYIWQFACNDRVCYGRTWPEYINLTKDINDMFDCYVVCFVHNLSFEFQFLSGIFEFSTEDVFCTSPRKILKATYNNIEYRCSMLLSNDSLDGFCEKHKVEHRKQSGVKFDYKKERYFFTPLTLFEYKYALYDVIGLVECIYAEMKAESRSLYTLPLTSTGYVRGDVKSILYEFNRYKQPFLQPTTEKLYFRLKEAFRGGNTHANRYFANKLIKEKGITIDISSDYPFQMCSKKFPMSGWRETESSFDNYIYLHKKGYCCMLVFESMNCKLKDKYDGFPSLSKSKCRNLVNDISDNGRILYAKYFETTTTDIDFEIFLNHYEADIIIKELYYCRYDYLPEALRKYILTLYKDKTSLKGITGEFAEIRYMQSKNRINAIYGLSVQDVLKAIIEYVAGEYIESTEQSLQERINKNVNKAYMSFSWGCWVVAYARAQLELGISAFTKNGYALYCDTDSVFGIGEINLDELNKEFLYYSKKHGLSAFDKNNNIHYMGVFELDKTFEEIKIMGAKKYVYKKDGELYVTIAGVNKKKGKAQLERDGIDALKDGYVFESVNSNATYNDRIDTYIHKYGKPIHITKNVAIEESDYTMGLTGDYEYILTHPACFENL